MHYGYEFLIAVSNIIKTHSPDVWYDLTPTEIVQACEACDDAGEWGYATPKRVSVDCIEWLCDDVCVASIQFKE